ncbi:hypothetical protein GCM10009777_11910 [Microbacterium pumilum]|uniref:Uncharacterized protein n=1 Tax=Microbacterium pumilum TaxID=344165 RepID=A0ABN2S4V3_9MICO
MDAAAPRRCIRRRATTPRVVSDPAMVCHSLVAIRVTDLPNGGVWRTMSCEGTL